MHTQNVALFLLPQQVVAAESVSKALQSQLAQTAKHLTATTTEYDTQVADTGWGWECGVEAAVAEGLSMCAVHIVVCCTPACVFSSLCI